MENPVDTILKQSGLNRDELKLIFYMLYHADYKGVAVSILSSLFTYLEFSQEDIERLQDRMPGAALLLAAFLSASVEGTKRNVMENNAKRGMN